MCKTEFDIETIEAMVEKFLTQTPYKYRDIQAKKEELISIILSRRFVDAVKLCAERDICGTAILQKRFNIGFGRALAIIDAMEALGLVTPRMAGEKPHRKMLPNANLFLHYMEKKLKIRIGDEIWCELEVSENICCYKLSIPDAYISDDRQTSDDEQGSYGDSTKKHTGIVEGKILCETEDDAVECMLSIKTMIHRGHGKSMCFKVGEMSIVELSSTIFDGTDLRFIHKNFKRGFDAPSLAEIAEQTRDSLVMLASFVILPDDYLSDWDTAYKAIYPQNKNASVFCQMSAQDSGYRTIDVWHR